MHVIPYHPPPSEWRRLADWGCTHLNPATGRPYLAFPDPLFVKAQIAEAKRELQDYPKKLPRCRMGRLSAVPENKGKAEKGVGELTSGNGVDGAETARR